MAAAGVPVAHGMTVSRFEAGKRARSAAALCGQARQRGLVGRRHHRQARTAAIRRRSFSGRIGRTATWCWPKRSSPGRELTCAVMGDKALGVIDIVAGARRVLRLRRQSMPQGGSIHVLPAKIKENVYQNVQELALKAHQGTGLSRREPRGLPIRRHSGWNGRTRRPGGQHAARHDGNVPRARTRGACRVLVWRVGAMDGGGRLLGSVSGAARLLLGRRRPRFARPSRSVRGSPRPNRRAVRRDRRVSRQPRTGRFDRAWLGIGCSGRSRCWAARASTALVRERTNMQAFVAANGTPARHRRPSSSASTIEAITISGLRRAQRSSEVLSRRHQPTPSLLFLDAAEVRDRLMAVPLVRDVTVRKLFPNASTSRRRARRRRGSGRRTASSRSIAADGVAIDDVHDHALQRPALRRRRRRPTRISANSPRCSTRPATCAIGSVPASTLASAAGR